MKPLFYVLLLFLSIVQACNQEGQTSSAQVSKDTVEMNEDTNCAEHLLALIKSSNFTELHNIDDNFSYVVDEFSSTKARIKIIEESDLRAFPLGWIIIDFEQNLMQDITIDQDNPQLLLFDSTLFRQYISCVKGEGSGNIIKIYPKEVTIDPGKGYVLNRNGASIYDKPNGSSNYSLAFNSEVQIMDTIEDWVQVVLNGQQRYIMESDIHNIAMGEIQGRPVRGDSIYRNYLGHLGDMTQINSIYGNTYSFTSSKISITKAYQLMKLFLSKKEIMVLPRMLPNQEIEKREAEFVFSLKIGNPKSKYIFSYEYSGGLTQTTITPSKDGIILGISYNAD